MDEDELEAVRARRLAELQAQYGGGVSGGREGTVWWRGKL